MSRRIRRGSPSSPHAVAFADELGGVRELIRPSFAASDEIAPSGDRDDLDKGDGGSTLNQTAARIGALSIAIDEAIQAALSASAEPAGRLRVKDAMFWRDPVPDSRTPRARVWTVTVANKWWHSIASASFVVAFSISVIGVFGVFGAMPRIASAQGATATLTGTIIDETDAGVPGVPVALLNVATQQHRQATTDREGGFVIPVLPPGRATG